MALSLRAGLLPVYPIPSPVLQDEYSYLLGGETFAKGRLTNPPHPLSEFFETFHVNLHPTYGSKYPPGQALTLSLGIAVLGHPWFGVLFSVGLMCGLVCWAIQGWLPSIYGLYGGVFTVLIFGLSHYWVNSYWGGAVAACGGALVLGAMPRLARRPGAGAAAAAACGVLVLANSRPYEGLLLICAAGLSLMWWVGGIAPAGRLLQPNAVLTAVLILGAGGVAAAYYNFAVTGSAITLPHFIHQRQYAATPVFWVLPPLPLAHREYRDRYMRELWEEWDGGMYAKARENPFRILKAFAELLLTTLMNGPAAPLGIGLLFAIALPCMRKNTVLLILLLIFSIGFCLEKSLLLHYAAPAIPAVILLAMQGMRVLRLVSVGSHRLGLRLTALLLVASVVMTALQIIDNRPGTLLPKPSQNAVAMRWSVERKLLAQPGQHVVVVRYGPNHSIHQEIVYNGPDIDSQKIVWAIDRGAVENRRLIEYYGGRYVWLLLPDPPNPTLSPYPNK